jgi:phage terminase large subunit-like protein
MTKGLGVLVNASNIVVPGTNSKFEPVIGKPGDGASPHCAIVDEFHEHPTAVLRDTMQTGMGARKQPLLFIISTAGDNIAGPCRDDWLQLEKILGGMIEDETVFGMIFGIDEGDDWTSEAALRKANPNFDISVGGDFLRQQQRTAIRDARKQGIFKIKHLNLWVTARNAFFNIETWRKLADPRLKIEDFAGKPCWIGVDLAAKVDLAVWIVIFPLDEKRVAIFGHYYVPDKTVEMPENQHYQKWAEEGILLNTPGNMTDLTQFRADVLAFAKTHEVKELAYDPDGATLLVQDLTAEGVKCVEMPQTYAILSDPMKQLDGMARDGLIAHNGDQILEWSISNTVGIVDRQDRVKPSKEKPELKIDPTVGVIMALRQYINREAEAAPAGVFFG